MRLREQPPIMHRFIHHLVQSSVAGSSRRSAQKLMRRLPWSSEEEGESSWRLPTRVPTHTHTHTHTHTPDIEALLVSELTAASVGRVTHVRAVCEVLAHLARHRHSRAVVRFVDDLMERIQEGLEDPMNR